MLNFIAEYWYIWATTLVISLGVLYYFKRKYSQRNFFFFIPAAIGCLITAFQALGAISALLTIIAMILRILVWKIKA